MTTTLMTQPGPTDSTPPHLVLDPPTGSRMCAPRLIGAAADIFGLRISLLLVPGAIFELTLAAWLLTKGSTAAAFEAPPALPSTWVTPTTARRTP